MKSKPLPWLLLLTFLLAFGILGLMTWSLRNEKKMTEQQTVNQGKIMFYKVTEMEALRRFAQLQVIKDSISTAQDSLKVQYLNHLNQDEIQEALNQIFNNPASTVSPQATKDFNYELTR